jgi:MFS transporter, OFA family, oxalate/formate antiporter
MASGSTGLTKINEKWLTLRAAPEQYNVPAEKKNSREETRMSQSSAQPGGYRWIQLVAGIVCMALVANLQYGWTFFVDPMKERHGWDRAAIQVAFTLFILFETWLVPIEGWFADKFGPRMVVLFGGLLAGIAWVMNSYAQTLEMLYLGAVVGGIGAGAVYGTCVGNALKWFPDRRGLAAGLTAMGFGAGSVATVIPIQNMIKSSGYENTFYNFGVGQGLFVVLIALMLRAPRKGEVPDVARVSLSRREYKPNEMAGTPTFWVMYLMFFMMAAGGLMATAQLAPIAKDFKVADVPITLDLGLFALTWTALTFAAAFDRVLNGVTRPFFGWISDRIGRENTMFIAFGLEGIGIYALSVFGQDPVLFVILSGLVFFAWGEIYSLFPATTGDTYGVKFAATNAGLLYTAKGTASLVVPYTNKITQWTGSWYTVFIIAAVLNIAAALMALAILKPVRRNFVSRSPEVTTFTKWFFSFDGRIGRDRVWGSIPIIAGIGAAFFLLDLGKQGSQAFGTVVTVLEVIGLAIAIFMLFSVAVKRCHDRGKSGWWSLLLLVPGVNLAWFIIDLGILPGESGAMRPAIAE